MQICVECGKRARCLGIALAIKKMESPSAHGRCGNGSPGQKRHYAASILNSPMKTDNGRSSRLPRNRAGFSASFVLNYAHSFSDSAGFQVKVWELYTS